MKSFLFRIVAFPLVLLGQPPGDVPVATVGHITITAKEFLSRYELAPGLQRRKNQTEANKGEFLLSLIAEKLLLIKGEQEGWDNDSTVNMVVAEVEKLLVRDELYRREVSMKVTIAESEVKSSMVKAQNDLKIYFLYSRTKEGADRLYQQIQKGKPLESFSFDESDLDDFSGPDSAVGRWGDVDRRMEQVIYSLKLNETSKPVHLDDGWYIAKLMGKTVTISAGERERAAMRERVIATLRKRKEISRMTDFMNDVLKSKRAHIDAGILKSIILHLHADSRARDPRQSDTAMYMVDASSMEYLHRVMDDTLRDVFVTFPHAAWSAEQTMEKIRESSLAIVRPSIAAFRADIEQRLREVIDQEFLAQIGYEKGLQQSNAVREELKVWRDAYRAQFVRRKIQDTIAVSPQDIESVRKAFGNDTAIVNNSTKAIEKVLEIKGSDVTDRVAANVANNTTITVYRKNLRDIQLTDTPSMVFRYLGFGGRMFAVPFVIPQTGWIRYWERKEFSLP